MFVDPFINRPASQGAARLKNEKSVVLLHGGNGSAWRNRKLQDGGSLTFAQVVHTHDLPIGKLQGVVMHMRLVHIDLPETSDLVRKLSSGQEAPSTLALDFVLERDFCSRK
jgi:hypothetical protein